MAWGWSSSSFAAPPLILAADVGEPGMEVWWREGDLLVGSPQQDGRPGMRPLSEQKERLQLPADLTGWTRLGKTCQDKPLATSLLDEAAITATISTDPAGHQIARVQDGQRVLAENTLGRPVTVCALALVQADALPGLELLVLWTLGEGADPIRGLTVLRVPEMARY